MGRPMRRRLGQWISADIGIAADLPSGADFASDMFRQHASDHSASKGQKRMLFCEWIKQRGAKRTDRNGR